jgi:glycosyltransferase involved in cell wall biosynthesis
MSLRVVFVAPFGLRHKTTVWARTLPIAQQLAAAGHNATILIPPWDSPQDAGRVEICDGVRMEQLSLAGGIVGTVRRLLQRIEESRPQIVHVVKPRAHAGLVQWWLWQRRMASPAKIVLDVDDWEQAWNPINRYNWFTAKFLAWQEEWGIRHAHGITAASRWLEQKVAAVAPQIPVLYLPNGVSPLDEALPNPASTLQSAPQILFFTRFVEVTPEWLLTFWRSLRLEISDAELLIAGTAVQPWLAQPFQSALAAEPQVQWKGYVPAEQLPELYASATCAIFPAIPIPLLQAKCSVRLATTLLHGVPVVASAVGEHASYGAQGAAHLVPAEATPQEFAQAVLEVIQNRDQHPLTRRQVTEKLLSRFAWAQLTEVLPAFYLSLLRAH